MNKKILILSLELIMLFLLFSCSSENIGWEKAEKENSIQAYEEFLNSNPDDPKTEDAKTRIEELFFEKAQSINTPNAYENFLKRYPKSKLADKALSNIQKHFLKEALSINTIPAYKEFISIYSEGLYADEASLRMERLYKERHPNYRKTKNVRIIIDQSYGIAKEASLPFEEVAKELCEYSGLSVIKTTDKDYDVTLRIKARGQPKGASYGDFRFNSKNYQFSGASISVTISLKVPGFPPYARSCNGSVSPPKRITDFKYSKPYEAPFFDALINSGFYTLILRVMQRIYGPNTTILALKKYEMAKDLLISKGKTAVESLNAALMHRDKTIRSQVASVLGEIGDSRSIEPLSDTLKNDTDVNVRETAVKALERIQDIRTVDPLFIALKDKDLRVRKRALNALEKLKWEPKTNDEKVTFYICKGDKTNLVKMGKDAVEPLVTALKHPDEIIHERAISALGNIGDFRAVDPLLAPLKDEDLQWQSLQAVKKITARSLGDNLYKWQRWWKKNKKKYLD